MTPPRLSAHVRRRCVVLRADSGRLVARKPKAGNSLPMTRTGISAKATRKAETTRPGMMHDRTPQAALDESARSPRSTPVYRRMAAAACCRTGRGAALQGLRGSRQGLRGDVRGPHPPARSRRYRRSRQPAAVVRYLPPGEDHSGRWWKAEARSRGGRVSNRGGGNREFSIEGPLDRSRSFTFSRTFQHFELR